MADVRLATEFASSCFPYNAGAFYGSAATLNLGIGLIYSGVKYADYNPDSRLFDTVEGLAYVLTHECDVDPTNERQFNDRVLVCPIILFEEFADEYSSEFSEVQLHRLLSGIAGDQVYRVFYLPPAANNELEFGGLLYLNQICSTDVSEFVVGSAVPICALSEYAQSILDRKIQNHLLRPKDQNLPRLR